MLCCTTTSRTCATIRRTATPPNAAFDIPLRHSRTVRDWPAAIPDLSKRLCLPPCKGALSFEDESQVLHRHLDHHPTMWGSVVRFPEPCNNVARARVDVKVKLLLMLQVGWWTAVSLPWSLRWHPVPWIAFTRVALPFSVKYREVCSRCRPISGLQDIFYICGDFPVLMWQVKGTFCHFRQAMKLLE